MAKQLVFHKGRYNSVIVNLGGGITGDTLTSEIRERPEQSSPLILIWEVTLLDTTIGELMLAYDDSAGEITHSKGFMDIKRVTGGSAVACFDEPLAVEFRGSVTE